MKFIASLVSRHVSGDVIPSKGYLLILATFPPLSIDLTHILPPRTTVRPRRHWQAVAPHEAVATDEVPRPRLARQEVRLPAAAAAAAAPVRGKHIVPVHRRPLPPPPPSRAGAVGHGEGRPARPIQVCGFCFRRDEKNGKMRKKA